MIHTENAGSNWSSQDLGEAGVALRDVCFVDNNEGWTVGQFARAYHTQNGGVTGIEDLTEAGFDISPNPASSVVNVRLENATESIESIELVSINGQMVSSEKVETNAVNIQLDVSDVAEGMYFLRIHTPSGILQKQISILK